MKQVRWTITAVAAAGVALAPAHGQVAAPPPPVAPPAPVKAAPPAPPRVVTVPIVAPPAPPAPKPADFGSAPKAAPASSQAFMDPKAAKQARKAREADYSICSNTGELKDWMLQNKLKACDRLLALPPVSGDLATWRAGVLAQRALALINLRDYKNALGALDEADELAKAAPDELYDLSTGVGSKMLRVIALNESGNKAGALATVEAIRKARPWSPTTASNADMLEATVLDDIRKMGDRLSAQQRLNPDVTRFLMILTLMQGDLTKAKEVAGRVSLIDPKMGGGWSLSGAQSTHEQFSQKIVFEALKAYTDAALGDSAGSKARFAAARAAIEAYVGKDPKLTAPQGTKPRKSDIEAFAVRTETGAKVTGVLDEWESIVELRGRAPSMSFDAVMKELNSYRNKGDLLPVVVELTRHYGKQRQDPDGLGATYFADTLTQRTIGAEYKMNPAKLGEFLPANETLDMIPKFASMASKWLFGDGSGYSQSKEGDGSIRTVRYESLTGSRAMVEELCLLAIANYARADGKDAFVILSNRTLKRQTTMYGGWGGSSTYDSGFESQMRVQLVNSASLPPEFAGQKDRVITVSEVETQLQPRYNEYMRRKEAIAAAKKAKGG